MKALIFNSGLGKRMGNFTKNNHKSMARLKTGETIFERQLRLLYSCGIRDFVVTTGPFEEQLKAVCAKPRYDGALFTFVNNPVYDKTNYIYSMYLAREYLDDDLLTLHGDLVFDRALLEAVLASPVRACGMVNKSRPLPEKDFKARVQGDNIREVSIKIFDADCFAFQPLYRLDRETVGRFLTRIGEFIARGDDKVYAENALNTLLRELDLRMFSYENYYIDEVDTLDDLARVAAEILPFDYREQPIFDGDDALQKAVAFSGKKPLIVAGKSFFGLPVCEQLKKLFPAAPVFGGFSPNPKYDECLAGKQAFVQNDCDSIIAVGGGSAIDVAKCIKLFAPLAEGADCLKQTPDGSATPFVAVPTTAGTGSESTRFAVIYRNGVKQSVTHECLLPDAVALIPELLAGLPDYQKRSAMLDALCQCVEAVWSLNSTEECREYASRGIKLVLSAYKAYFNGDPDARADILKAANLSGLAINIARTTAGHAMSYKLAARFGISHGHAVALCMLELWPYMIANPNDTLTGAFSALCSAFKTDDISAAFGCFAKLFADTGLKKARSDEPGLTDKLADSVDPARLKNNPIPLSRETLVQLYGRIIG